MAEVVEPKHVLACGVFDVFHAGHLRYLQYARSQGASLTVAVVRDVEALRVKGRRPQLDEQRRLQVVEAMGCVDRAMLQPRSLADVAAALDWIPALGVDHLFLGGMWADDTGRAELAARLLGMGITTQFAPVTEGISTTKLLNAIRAGVPLRSDELISPSHSTVEAMPRADVLAFGVFDLLHCGHVRYLRFAATQGERLAVAVCPDQLCMALKAKLPIMQESHRLELIRGLRCVDQAALMPCGTEETLRTAEWVKAWGVRRLVVGAELAATPRMQKLSKCLKQDGIDLVEVLPSADVSTSMIIERARQVSA